MELNNLLELVNHPLLFMVLFVGLDSIIGDPVYRYHPVRLLGNTLQFYENLLFKYGLNLKIGGVVLTLLLLTTALSVTYIVHWGLSAINPFLAWVWNLFVAYSMFALKDLNQHGKRVANATNEVEARKTVSMLVGRDTKNMSVAGCNRAAIESLSENLSDGAISPLFYYVLFGVEGMVIFKVASTLDSMVGYKNERYLNFGWFGARLDDVLNFIPARLTWLLISMSALFIKGLSPLKAFKTGCTQHAKIAGPNAGWPQATAAGALNIKLVGQKLKDGKVVSGVWLGDENSVIGASSNEVFTMIQINLASVLIFMLLSNLKFLF